MQWFGKPVNFNRFLGQVDSDDPTNLPVGLAAICENTDFTLDSQGQTSANTRAGVNLALQVLGLNGKPSNNPVTGAIDFRYSPELASDAALFGGTGAFKMPIFFEAGGQLNREYPVGGGRCQKLPASALFTAPAPAHMIGCSVGNKVLAAFSDLIKPLSGGVSIDPKSIMTNGASNPIPVAPLGMRPFGWNWQPNTAVLAGEVCTPAAPSTGNGHTYVAQNSGTTGAAQPGFSAADPEGKTYNDNGIIWKEQTIVVANRLPAPAAPALALVNAGGTFPDGQTVYVLLTFQNNMGETVAGAVANITTTAANQGVQVTVPALAALAGWLATLAPQYAITQARIYEADLSSGSPAPPQSAFGYAASAALGTTPVIASTAGGAAPPTSNTARVTPGQLPTPVVSPAIERVPAGGAFPAGRDVYVLQTYLNATGETTAGPASMVAGTVAGDAVQATLSVPEDDTGAALYAITQIGIYEADVASGEPAPPADAFSLVGHYATTATVTITASAAGSNPPISNTTGPGGAIQRDTSTGGPNGTQGFRWITMIGVNQNETFSGFTIASAVPYDVDEDGWELGVFNLPLGPENWVARCVVSSPADASQTGGPWNWIGVLNLIDPTANVVYPQTIAAYAINQTSTCIYDRVTTQVTLNFDDTFLSESNNVDDRTDILPPFQAVRVDYLKTVDCVAYSGVLGYTGGGLISVPGDYESVYADVGPVPFPADGKECFGFTDAYKSVIFALREDGGYALQPNSGSAGGWNPVQRWTEVGPCGFRAWAAIGRFIFFVHRSGAYYYDQSDPSLVSLEVPNRWATINWDAAEQVAVTIDEDTRTVRIHVPTNGSPVNNEEFVVSYLEGWSDPIHFSSFLGKETSQPQARRWSFNNVAATMSIRMARNLPQQGPQVPNGPNWEPLSNTAAYRTSQLLFLSSAPDGTVHARTPGVYRDNGRGIPWKWRSTCAGMMQMVCKPEGINLNAAGSGRIYARMMASRAQDTDNQEDDGNGEGQGEPMVLDLGQGYFDLTTSQSKGISLKCEPAVNEFWSVEFDNGAVADVWCSLKQMNVYIIPFTVGRDYS